MATFAKTAAKLVIGGSAVYGTASQGVWSTSPTETKAVDTVNTNIIPSAQTYVKQVFQVDEEENERKNNRVIDGWNYGVQCTFEGIGQVPSIATDYPKKAVTELKKSYQS